MSLVKYIGRLKKMDELIQNKSTGTAEEFAKQLGISVSVLKENIREMKELGASIDFSRINKSYYYSKQSYLWLNFEKSRIDNDKLISTKGGNGYNRQPLEERSCRRLIKNTHHYLP